MNVDVLPRNDQVAHEHSDDCVCGPEVVPVEAASCGIGWVRVHHALDGRM